MGYGLPGARTDGVIAERALLIEIELVHAHRARGARQQGWGQPAELGSHRPHFYH